MQIFESWVKFKEAGRCLARLCVTSKMGQCRRETAINCRKGRVLAEGFLGYSDRFVETTKLDKRHPHSYERQVALRSTPHAEWLDGKSRAFARQLAVTRGRQVKDAV